MNGKARRSVPKALKIVVVVLFGFAAKHAAAAPTYYELSVDDFGSLVINGSQVASYDAYPWGNATGSVDLAPGWYPISLSFKNRWGTSALRFSERSDPQEPWDFVPLSHLRSHDGTGALVEGLRADYYALDGALLGTVFGEGPIAHGWANYYEGEAGKSGGAIVDLYWRANWRTFEERLTGEIYVSGAAVPEPAPLSLLFLGLGMLAFTRRIPPSVM